MQSSPRWPESLETPLDKPTTSELDSGVAPLPGEPQKAGASGYAPRRRGLGRGPVAKRAWRIVGFVLLALLIVSAVGLVYLSTDAGHRKLADVFERVVSDNVPGTMRIGKLERIGFFSPVVSNLRFLDTHAVEVLQVDHAHADLDVLDLLRGHFSFHHAEADGGHILLAVGPDGRATIEAALHAPSDPRDTSYGLHYALRAIHFEHLRATIKPGKDAGYGLRDLAGDIDLIHVTTKGIRIGLYGISGDVEQKLLGAHLGLKDVNGWVHGDAPQIIDLHVSASIGDGAMDAHMELYDRDKAPVKITLVPKHGFKAHVIADLIDAASWFSHDLSVDVK